MRPKDKNSDLTIERLKEVLLYEPLTGLFYWRVLPHKSASNIKVGDVAGSIENTGYIRVWIDGRRYQGHRLAWFYTYGVWPIDRLDHRDRVKSHNWIKNLREADDTQNSINRKVHANNLLGVRGIQMHKASGKYRPRIFIDGKHVSLGLFETLEEAIVAREKKAKEVFGEFAESA